MTTAGVGYVPLSEQALEVVLLAVTGLLVLLYDSSYVPRWRDWVRRWGARLARRPDLSWVDPWLLASAAAVVIAGSQIFYWSIGGYDCRAAGPSDLTTLFTSGRAFLTGGNPFTITACGHGGNPVPAGLASVLLDAFGALWGPVGILVVWGAISVALVPLLWSVAGTERAVATAFVVASPLYFPIVISEDGASLALVPFAVLAFLYLGRRKGWVRAAAVGGFLATGRFPALFPVVGTSGRAGTRKTASALAALGAFGAVTLATIAAYGSRFTGPVFFLQFGRATALNYWGILEGERWLLPSTAVTVIQACLTTALVGVCWLRARSDLGSAAIVLTGTTLLAQFLSLNELVFLLPVALTGRPARWWLWAIGVVATTSSLLKTSAAAWAQLPFYALCAVLTGFLAGLFIELVRTDLTHGR